MKLVTFTHNSKKYVGTVKDDLVINLNKLLNEPSLEMLDLVKRGLENLKKIEEEISDMDLTRDSKYVHQLNKVHLKAPLENPGKIVCVGLNYMDHCREQNIDPPKSPLIFSKWPSCIVGPEENIVLPRESKEVDYEAELGVIFDTKCKNISKENVLNHIFGYVIVNDVSARDVQFSDGQWVRGKSYDTFAPSGPYIVTADEIENPHNLAIRCTVNGVVLQNSNTSEMIFSINEIAEYLSEGFTFYPGDLLLTGTPDGVGVFRNPQVFLKDGDEVIVEIEGLGKLRNKCVRLRQI